MRNVAQSQTGALVPKFSAPELTPGNLMLLAAGAQYCEVAEDHESGMDMTPANTPERESSTAPIPLRKQIDSCD